MNGHLHIAMSIWGPLPGTSAITRLARSGMKRHSGHEARGAKDFAAKICRNLGCLCLEKTIENQRYFKSAQK
jgi:hypothetical protein